METTKRQEDLTEGKIHFAVMAIEAGAKQMGISPKEMRRRLERADLVDRFIFGCYETLHTESLQHLGEDIAEALRNWEARMAKGSSLGEKGGTAL